eukprot:GFKZ01005361.1.p1 GENE.GFKZ01005361.1~~GFKZ01005361.1.p1  ORF type:complete len:273 (+),score=18.92 GFKZ01005361.1:350-1168(+)
MTRTVTTTRLSLDLSNSRHLTHRHSLTHRNKSGLPEPITSSTLPVSTCSNPHPQNTYPNRFAPSEDSDDQHVEPIMADISSLLETMHSKNLTLKKLARKQQTLIDALRAELEVLKSDIQCKDLLINSKTAQLTLLQQQAKTRVSKRDAIKPPNPSTGNRRMCATQKALHPQPKLENNISPKSGSQGPSASLTDSDVRSPPQKPRLELVCTLKLALDRAKAMPGKSCNSKSLSPTSLVMSTLYNITRSVVHGTILALLPGENRPAVGVALVCA